MKAGMMAAMKQVKKLLFLAVAAALIGSACGGNDPETTGGSESPQPQAATPPAEPDSGEPDDGGSGEPGEKPADLAPDFTVETFDEDTFTLAEHRGTPVVLNFWESW